MRGRRERERERETERERDLALHVRARRSHKCLSNFGSPLLFFFRFRSVTRLDGHRHDPTHAHTRK